MRRWFVFTIKAQVVARLGFELIISHSPLLGGRTFQAWWKKVQLMYLRHSLSLVNLSLWNFNQEMQSQRLLLNDPTACTLCQSPYGQTKQYFLNYVELLLDNIPLFDLWIWEGERNRRLPANSYLVDARACSSLRDYPAHKHMVEGIRARGWEGWRLGLLIRHAPRTRFWERAEACFGFALQKAGCPRPASRKLAEAAAFKANVNKADCKKSFVCQPSRFYYFWKEMLKGELASGHCFLILMAQISILIPCRGGTLTAHKGGKVN